MSSRTSLGLRPRATSLEILSLLTVHVSIVLGAAFKQLISITFLGKKRTKSSTLKDVFYAAMRAHLSRVSLAQELWLPPISTESVYLDWAKRAKVHPVTTRLDDGLGLHWIGPKTAEKVVLYFHGGGYLFGASPGHLPWLAGVQTDLSTKLGSDVAIVLVAYTLSSEKSDPQQTSDAVEALRYLLKVAGKKPGNICVGGDSAGGHLTIALLSHLMHPHPEIEPVVLEKPLATAVLISPFYKVGATDGSWRRNKESDIVPLEAAERWTGLYLGGRPKDNYNTPRLASPDWFIGLNEVVNDMLIWGGGGECFIDGIKDFHELVKSVFPKTELVVEEGAAHEEFILDVLLGYKEKAEATKRIEEWIGERL